MAVPRRTSKSIDFSSSRVNLFPELIGVLLFVLSADLFVVGDMAVLPTPGVDFADDTYASAVDSAVTDAPTPPRLAPSIIKEVGD